MVVAKGDRRVTSVSFAKKELAVGAECLLLKLTAKGVELGLPGGGVAEIARMDVAAALGYPRMRDDGVAVRLHRLAYLWAMRFIAHDVCGHDELLAGLARQVSPMQEVAYKHRDGVAVVAVIQRHRANHCPACNGQKPKCKSCNGSGVRQPMSKRRQADFMGLSERSFRRHEDELVKEVGFIYGLLGSYEQQVSRHLAYQLFEQEAA